MAQFNINNIIDGSSERGLHALSLAVCHGAIHDSAQRFPPPIFQPDTRKAVRQIIMDWIHTESSVSLFFWLYGPAGSGKTAILQAIAEFLCGSSESDENFGGSFFFSRGKHDQGRFLFSTIAYQLALTVPGLHEHVNRIMEADPTLPTKSMAIQLQSLIIDSFRRLSPLPQRSYLVIIDGLDECSDKVMQQSILQLLCKATTDSELPLRFLIGSRPEFQIRTIFDQESLYKITKRVVLDETFSPGKDIEVFLEDGFAKIYARNADILSHVNQPWPGRGIIDLLVQRSSGQFIYAATLLKFVGADFCNPITQLALILKSDPTAFSDLDPLYTQILSVYPNTVTMVQVLGTIVAFTAKTLTPQVIGDILGMEEHDVMLVLRCLSSLIVFMGDETRPSLSNDYIECSGPFYHVNERYPREEVNVGSVYFTHASFGDYLEDPSRSGPFHVKKSEYKNQSTIKCFSLISGSIGRSWRIPPSRIPHSETWDYFKKYLALYLTDSPKVVLDAIMTDIHDLVQDFWQSAGGVVTVDISFTAVLCLLDILNRSEPTFAGHPDIINEFQKMLDHLLSQSRELGDLIVLLPGIIVQRGLTMQGITDLYGIKMDSLERLMQFTIQPLKQSYVSPRYTLQPYLSRFLQDRDRSQLLYCDPLLHHIYICHHFLALLDGSNASDLQSNELSTYALYTLYEHLCFITEIFFSTQNVLSDHPAIEFINDLEKAPYCSPNASKSHCRLAQCVITAVLRWTDMLSRRRKDAAVSISNADFIERACRLTDRIYRETLCIEMDESTMIIAFTVGLTPGLKLRKAVQHWTEIQISWELLDIVSVDGGILRSFTEFITTPEISGSLYISPDVYHTQITEYSLETLYRHNNDQASPFNLGRDSVPRLDYSFKDHISQALPTEMIFHILRSLSSSSWEGTVVKWLEGLGSERPTDLYDRCRVELEKRKKTVDSVYSNFGKA